MQYRRLGRTGLKVSAISLGAGPVPQLMLAGQERRALQVVRHAIDSGINWFDTAATYSDGQSETTLGQALARLAAHGTVHIATKVRLLPQHLGDIAGEIRRSLAASLARLQMPHVTLLQLHNSITRSRGDEPTSLTPADALGEVLETFERLRDEGLVQWYGLTGIGQADALREVIESGKFDTMQAPYSLANPSAGQDVPESFTEADYGNLFAACAKQQMGVFAIRIFAGGALAGQPPSPHTYKTKFFPLDLYQRDQQRAALFAERFGSVTPLKELALRFALSHEQVASAIVGFSDCEQIDEAVAHANAGPLPGPLIMHLRKIAGKA